jgi:hypothetical protein
MPRRFSRTFPTYADWAESQPSRSPYAIRIARGHGKRPSASLGQLRRHPRKGQRSISSVRSAPRYSRSLFDLSFRERLQRQRALEVVSEARRGKGTLSGLSRSRGMSPKTVRRASGAFRKRDGRWVPTRSDRVERFLKTYEHGVRTEVLVSDSRTASLLSRYSNAVGKFIETGDASALRAFEGKTYRNASGTVHALETDPQAIRAAIERSELDFGAFADLYAEPEEAEDTG